MSTNRTNAQTPENDVTQKSASVQASMPPDSRRDTLEDLLSYIDSLPKIPWEGGDSPEDDKRTLAERYMD